MKLTPMQESAKQFREMVLSELVKYSFNLSISNSILFIIGYILVLISFSSTEALNVIDIAQIGITISALWFVNYLIQTFVLYRTIFTKKDSVINVFIPDINEILDSFLLGHSVERKLIDNFNNNLDFFIKNYHEGYYFLGTLEFFLLEGLFAGTIKELEELHINKPDWKEDKSMAKLLYNCETIRNIANSECEGWSRLVVKAKRICRGIKLN